MYSLDLQFEDNIRNVRTRNIKEYIFYISKIRILSHFKWAAVKLDVLKVTQHPEDSTVRVRWRVVGVPGFISLRFWKKSFMNLKQFKEKDSSE